MGRRLCVRLKYLYASFIFYLFKEDTTLLYLCIDLYVLLLSPPLLITTGILNTKYQGKVHFQLSTASEYLSAVSSSVQTWPVLSECNFVPYADNPGDWWTVKDCNYIS